MSTKFLILTAAAVSVSCAVYEPARADDSGVAYMHDMRKVGGRSCFADHEHYGSGTGPNKATARRAAIMAWQDFTAFEYGTDWANFGKAIKKTITCSGNECQVIATPCK